MKKIISFNANGLRSAMTKGLMDWINTNAFDLICIQETKMDSSHADPDYFLSNGYHSFWHCAEKKGYSGVLILSKVLPLNVHIGTGFPIYDSEGRLIVLDFPDFSIANCYFPSGSSSEERHAFKMKFLHDMYPVFAKMVRDKKNLIVVGDYNIHPGIDQKNVYGLINGLQNYFRIVSGCYTRKKKNTAGGVTAPDPILKIRAGE
jgi:exodeoxyribonuclease III